MSFATATFGNILLIAAFLGHAFPQVQRETGAVTGRLLKNGQPAAGIRVSAMVIPEPGVPITEVSSLASVVLSESDGRYRLENIPPGRYYITAGFLDIPTYYPGVSAISGATPVNVEAGSTTTGIDFTTVAPSGARVSGRVVFPPSQTGAANRQAMLMGGGVPAQQTALSADGSFEFLRLRPGTYTLQVPGAGAAQNTSIIVGGADITDVEIVVPYTVSGNVLVENGGTLPRFSISLVAEKGGPPAYAGTLSQNGALRFDVPDGDYRLTFSGLPTGYTVKSITAGSTDLSMDTLKVSPDTTPPSIAVTLGVSSPPPGVKVQGKVTGNGFSPGTPYQVTLSGASLFTPLNFPIAADGSFELPQVLPGDYKLGLSAQNVSIRTIELSVRSETTNVVEMALPAVKEVTARVTIEGQPLSLNVAGTFQTFVVFQNSTRTAAGQTLTFRSSTSLDFDVTDPSGTSPVSLTRQNDGTFRAKLPIGARRVAFNFPGYTVKSLSYGSTDLLESPLLNVSETEDAQLDVALVPSPATNTGGGVSWVRLNVANPVGTAANQPIFIASNATAATYTILQTSGAGAAPNSTAYLGPDLAEANLATSVPPIYPPQAQGAVKSAIILRVFIDKEGKVTNAAVVQGNPLLNDAAIEAVKQWRYRPQLVNGQAADVVTIVRLEL